MMRAAFYTVCLGLFVVSPAGADVYKYTDEKGNVQYTDRPLTLPAERLNIHSQRTDAAEVDKRTADESKAAAERNKARQSTATSSGAKKEKTEELTGAKKEDACAKAREDYRVRTTNWRLYDTDEKGERRYLSATEVDAARDAAKQAMDELCK